MNNNNKILYLLLIICILGWNCSNIKAGTTQNKANDEKTATDSLSKEEYTKWYSENINDFSVTRKMNKITYKLEYVPTELMQVSQSNYENGYDKFLIFILKIELENESDILKYPSAGFSNLNEKVHYFSFDMQRFINLIVDHNTIPCTIFNYEKNYGLKPFTEFTVGFDKASVKSQNFMVQLNDQYFGSGEINFSINNSIINKTPKLKTNK